MDVHDFVEQKAILLAAAEALDAGGFEYAIYGGVAVGVWGQPRSAEDVDLVLFIHENAVVKFLRAASAAGFAVDEKLAVQQIQISGWARLPLGEPDSPWHPDLTLGDSPFDQSAPRRRERITLFDRDFWVVSPEDLVIYKLVSGRPRDVPDASTIVANQKTLDLNYMRRWAAWWKEQGAEKTPATLEKILRQQPGDSGES